MRPERGLRFGDLAAVPSATSRLIDRIAAATSKVAESCEAELRQFLFEPGGPIFAQGEPSDLAYLIRAGSVDIVVVDAAGAERRFALLGPEEVFSEMRVIDPIPRSATALARERTGCDAYSAG